MRSFVWNVNQWIFVCCFLRLLTISNVFEQGVLQEERPFNPSIKASDAFYYDIEKLICDNKTCLQVACDEDRVVACGYAQIRPSKQSLQHDQHGYLGFMFVLPEYRGKGINKMIMDFLSNWCKGHGITDLYLDVYAQNTSAIRAYEKVGFEPCLVEMKLNLSR